MNDKISRIIKSAAALLLAAVVASGLALQPSSAQELFPRGSIEGYLLGISGNAVTIEDYDGDIHTLLADEETELSMDMETIYSLSEFKRGMEVYIEYSRSRIEYMDGYSTAVFAQIDPQTKTRTGTVVSAGAGRLSIRDVMGKVSEYTWTPATVSTRAGVNVKAESIVAGDRVKLFFDTYDTSEASRIEVQGRSVLLKGVYRGVIGTADRYDDTITLQKLEVLRNGKWEKVSNASMRLSADGKAYVGGYELSRSNIGYYKGRTAYMAVGSFFGADSIEKLVIKDSFERLYSERVDELSAFSSQIELSNKRNVTLTPASIVVRGGRLVDTSAVQKGQSALVVSDSSPSGEAASVVMITGEVADPAAAKGSFLYSARLEQILPYQIKTKRLYALENHEWESMSAEEFTFDEETYIYDAEKGEKLDVARFASGEYDDSKDAYIYAQGDRASLIMLIKDDDSTRAERVTSATAQGATYDSRIGWLLNTSDASDYSARKEAWIAKTADLTLVLDGALIVKDGAVIKPQDVKAGDSLYVVRDGNVAKVIFVKD